MSGATRADVCIVACAEAFRGDGEIMASPMGLVPALGARLAKATFEPDLVLTDGVASIVAGIPAPGKDAIVEAWMPYRGIFDVVWWGRRHVMMGASQIDRHGNQNISCIGPWQRPAAQLLGVRGAPGNTINHTTSYWIPRHDRRAFVPEVDVVSGVGYDRAAALGRAGRFHEIRRVVSNLGVFDFATPDDSSPAGAPPPVRAMRVRSVHPGVTIAQIVENTGFPLIIPADVPETRLPTAEELELIRSVLDPAGHAQREVTV